MFGIQHTINSKDKWGYVEICKPYIREIEKDFIDKKYKESLNSRLTPEQHENSWRTHLWNVYWYMYLSNTNGRVRKQCLRKMFNYWYKCPDAWGEYNENYINYDVISPWPLFCTSEVKSLSGDSIVFPKIIDILTKHHKALTKKQQNIIYQYGKRI